VLTLRKASDLADRENAEKRGGGGVFQASSSPAADRDSATGLFDAIASGEPNPELVVMFDEQYRTLRHQLGDDSLRQVLDMRLEGYAREEIAARLGCTVRTVTRKLDVIRRTWLQEDLV
jgi:DNA-binding CsgD family transcriptional regulator